MFFTEETEFINVPKKLAKVIKENEKDLSTDVIFKKYFEEVRNELRIDLESFDEETTLFKAGLIKARVDFNEAKDEQIKGFYNIWENANDEIQKLRQKVEEVKNLLNPVKKEIEEINEALENVNMWKMKDIIEVVEKFRNMRDEEKKMIEFLIKNYNNKG